MLRTHRLRKRLLQVDLAAAAAKTRNPFCTNGVDDSLARPVRQAADDALAELLTLETGIEED